jgi:recombinational DNA repair protein (RecF pathway)
VHSETEGHSEAEGQGSPEAGHTDSAGASAAGDREVNALGYVGYFAELLDEWAPEADADERLYRLGASMLGALGAGVPVERLARYFEYWLLRLQGVYPEARGVLSRRAMAFLEASRTIPPDRIGEVQADRRTLRELEQLHRGLITMHLDKTLKSDRVLRDLHRHS